VPPLVGRTTVRDLDLDRYFDHSADDRLYLYDELSSVGDTFIRFRQSKNNTMRASRGTAVKKAKYPGKDRDGYVADLGAVDVPPRSWSDISARIRPEITLDAKIQRRQLSVVLLRYLRGNHHGIIALEVRPTTNGIEAQRLTSAANTVEARTARAGLQMAALRHKRVAVVGLGALGSFVADMLARSGVRHMTFVDGDKVLPGNIIRHLVGPESVGLLKVEAVRSHVVARNEHNLEDIELLKSNLTTAETAAHLIQSHDLVVNATANFGTTALLRVTAEALGANVVSAALQNDGGTYRIDLLPPLEGAPSLPSSSVPLNNGDRMPELFEAGCGSPISPTPPHAVIEAAAAAVRHSIGLLTGHVLHPAGESRNLTTAPERHHA
jgi:molybdopterin/thiamine biosynthesis adenylyltransferase